MKRSVLFCHCYQQFHSQTGIKSHYTHFFPKSKLTQKYDNQSSIFKVIVEESKWFHGCYWGYWCYQKRLFLYIEQYRSAIERFFPAGLENQEYNHKGITLPVKITVVE